MIERAAETVTLSIQGEDGVVAARSRARELARELGFGMVDQSRIATAVSELARNVVRYAAGSEGEVVMRAVRDRAGRAGLEIVVSDRGPGIEDIELVLRDGYSSGNGLGMGLPGARRLMGELELESAPGRGTTVTIRKWRR